MPPDTLALAIVVAGTGAGAAIDLRTRRVPNPLTLSLACAGLALAATGFGRVGVAAALAGGVVGLALMLPGHVFGATGGGDVKLLGAAGTLLGPAATLWAFILTVIAGGALALVIAAHRGRLRSSIDRSFGLVVTAAANAGEVGHPDAGNRFAYAPAIAAGAIAAAAFV